VQVGHQAVEPLTLTAGCRILDIRRAVVRTNSPNRTGAVPATLMYPQYLFQTASRLAADVAPLNHACWKSAGP
jgi:hypothetical protein